MENKDHSVGPAEAGREGKAEAFIDLERVIASKSPRLLKALPGFIISYLKRVIHQEELNAVMAKYRDLKGLEYLDHIFTELGAVVQVRGLEHIPASGRYIVASNHPLGGLDGMALMKVVGQVRPDMNFPVNDLLMNIPNMHGLFAPINKHGSNSQNVQILNEIFDSEKIVLFFPAGLCSRKIKGKIVDLEWKKSFITRARRHERDVIPTFIDGRNSNFFYNLANLRKTLRIKSNIEMLYLVDEMFKQKNKVIRIQFSRPLSYKCFDKRYSDEVWASKVRELVYQIPANSADYSLFQP